MKVKMSLELSEKARKRLEDLASIKKTSMTAILEELVNLEYRKYN